ncbi:MAG TPA: sulfotransferase [Isosphaeraceae bacterium]|jgi:hypothetical protein|nr:sulfotransferase [Isosphaeraceae bacterium]
MIHLLRLVLARNLVHMFEGITFGEWVELLKAERFRVDPSCWPRAAWITAMSLRNSVVSRAVERRFGAAIEATKVEAPVFVLGHFRSGTTHLQELLALDPRFAVPTRFQTFNPRTFLGASRWSKAVVESFMLPRRVQEDEVAYMVLTRLSPYMDWCFPRSRSGYGHTLTFRGARPEEVAAWSAAVVRFLKSVTLQAGRRLVLKSPPHTGRARLLLEAFPDARFVHIRRDPYAVFASTMTLLRHTRPVFRLQRGPRAIDVEAVLRTYTEMYDAYFDDRAAIPPGQLVEVAYEDLERDPVGQVRAIYEGLSLGDFEPVRPTLERYLASIAGFEKNRHRPLDDATRRRVAEAWSRCFEAWGYPR